MVIRPRKHRQYGWNIPKPPWIFTPSKIASERLVRQAQLPTVVLRIAGIAVPALQEPPPVWPFTAEQRLEMVHREDVVTALYKASLPLRPKGKR